jgi:uncharacterized protein YbjQ (UPF0145 family)
VATAGQGDAPGSTLAGRIVHASSVSPTAGSPERGHGSPGAPDRIGPPPAVHAASSALSVDELLLVGAAGYVPKGIVVGAAVFHVGLVGARVASGELVPLSEALLAAREQAVAGMRDQAARLGAAGVVGARVEIAAFEDRHHLARVLAVGTAVDRAMPGHAGAAAAGPLWPA